jgi:hypothetical protein
MQLVYRAASYTYQPVAPALLSVKTTTLHTLLYRGQVYHSRKPVPHAPTARTLNWRFSQVCNPQDAALESAPA